MAKENRHNMPPGGMDMGDISSPKALTRIEFGRRLHRHILERGWNQSDLGRESGLGRDSISSYINGQNFPTPKNLTKLAEALNINREDLLPNSVMLAIDADEHPALEIKQAVGHPGVSWLRINRKVKTSTAVKILALIEEDNVEQ